MIETRVVGGSVFQLDGTHLQKAYNHKHNHNRFRL